MTAVPEAAADRRLGQLADARRHLSQALDHFTRSSRDDQLRVLPALRRGIEALRAPLLDPATAQPPASTFLRATLSEMVALVLALERDAVPRRRDVRIAILTLELLVDLAGYEPITTASGLDQCPNCNAYHLSRYVSDQGSMETCCPACGWRETVDP
ncbi:MULTISPECIES: hypothetical protein [unclassified Devosia]|uniref:hypothetical protein n=1 Tax=unclassified Devosia TaxID=196773 RepID=UPI001AC23715|nr:MULTISPECIES: hypothetical protein [unclassified Devosia]MBN9304799.1 hypothetical protein [Devosia sp.]